MPETETEIDHRLYTIRRLASSARNGHPINVGHLANEILTLDSMLSAGATPPEAWREGPDAPELDGAGGLTREQRDVIAHHNGLGVPIQWFTGAIRDDESVEMIAMGDGFAWSLIIEPNGDYRASEAQVNEWSTGIDV